MTPLDTLVAAASQEPPELPRLPAAQVFIKYESMGKQIERLTDCYKALPSDTPSNFTEHLLDIARICDSISKVAMRLVEASR